MDINFKKQLGSNCHIYKKALDRIINKYSKLRYQDGGFEVDLENTESDILGRYMDLSKVELSKLESKSLADLRNESLGALDVTRNSQWEYNETLASTSQFYGEDDEKSKSDTSQLTARSFHDSEENFLEMDIQPEDQDEELEMSLRNNGTWMDAYPSMISRIEMAWHQMNVSEAADSVLRRYRKWRKHSNGSNMGNTSIVTLQRSKPKPMTNRMLLLENGPERRQHARSEYFPRSPLKTERKLQDWKAQPFPVHQTGPHKREQHQPLVMDFYDPPETPKPQEILLSETFSVSDVNQLREQSYNHYASPSRSCDPIAKAALDRPFQTKRLSLSAHSEQTTCSALASEHNAAYSSPVRQSPLKARMLTSFGDSPRFFSRSPKEVRRESFSRETARSPSLSSPSQKPTRTLYPPDSNRSLQPSSLQSARAEGRARLRRHLSFDSSQPSLAISYAPDQIDEDLKKLYHKFVCQNKSFSNSPPCRFCAEHPGANQGHPSAALSALSLSPHRSLLRKRQRASGWDSHPLSKRSREEYSMYSPGSKRRKEAALRHCLPSSQFEQYHADFPYSPSKHSRFLNVSAQQPSADTRMTRGWPLSAAAFSGQGDTLESRGTHSYSPRCRK